MHTFLLLLLTGAIASNALGQRIEDVITKQRVEQIQLVLSADSMSGRKPFTPGIEKAAAFIAGQFQAAGLKSPDGQAGFRQEFIMVKPRLIRISGHWGNLLLDSTNSIVITSLPLLRINELSGFEKASIKAGSNFFSEAAKFIHSNKNYLVLVDTGFSGNFVAIRRFRESLLKSEKSVLFVLTSGDATKFSIEAIHEVTAKSLANLVGILPGKSGKKEYVVFSAHYDHLGTGKPVSGDSVYNGANDDASGVTAVIMLAEYFKSLGSNQVTLVFAAFTEEESGGFGSRYFSTQFNAEDAKAMLNIEMIGTDSKWGKNTAYITGYEKTDLGKILEKNLQGTGFRFYPDPYPEQQLFYRSDNASLARFGVPAHTISTSKMDNEPFYHTVNDEIQTLDMDNMTLIIKAIALSAKSIVSGEDSPTRLEIQQLR